MIRQSVVEQVINYSFICLQIHSQSLPYRICLAASEILDRLHLETIPENLPREAHIPYSTACLEIKAQIGISSEFLFNLRCDRILDQSSSHLTYQYIHIHMYSINLHFRDKRLNRHLRTYI